MPRANKNDLKYTKKKETIELDLTIFKPITIVSTRTNVFVSMFIFLFAMIIYQLTNAKTTSFWDAGEYISVSSIFGIAHPPGNPFYILLGRVFTIFNLGFDHAPVISFLSSFFSALASVMVYLITVKLLSMWREDSFSAIVGGVVAALFTAFSFTFWMNAVEASVYGLSAFIVLLVTWLTFVWVKHEKGFSHQNILLLITYLFFLGFCVHQTVLQIAPAILFIVVLPYIRNSLNTAGFWIRFCIFSTILLTIYFIFNDHAADMGLPEIEKFAVGVAIMGITCWYLRHYIDYRMWLLFIGLVIVGFSPHLFLIIRSEFRPFINQGHPHNYELFMQYILRQQYGGYNFLERRATLWTQLDFHFLRYLSWQFMDTEVLARWLNMPIEGVKIVANTLVAFLGLSGFYYAYRKNVYAFWYLFSLFFMTSVAMVFVMNLSDREVRDRDYFFVSAYNMWSIAMGLGVVGLISMLRETVFGQQNKIAVYALSTILLCLPVLNMATQYHKHDRTGEKIALDYGLNIINSLEENAIVFTNGDNDTFPVWYAQSVRDKFATENIYTARDVYPTERTVELLRNALEWKTSHINGIRRDVSVLNLSLLNVPWYIKQIRDLEGVELNWNDDVIDRLVATPWRHSDLNIEIRSPNGDRFHVVYPAREVLMIKDQVVARIIQENFGKRPIYFAITCADYSQFDDFLINEGMVSRVVSTRGDRERVDYDRLKNNLTNVYNFRGIFDDKLYKDSNMVKLVSNYGAAFMRLSDQYHRQANLPNIDEISRAEFYDKAINYYLRGAEFILNPPDQIRFHGLLTLLYAESGQKETAIDRIEVMIAEQPDTFHGYLYGALSMQRAQDIDLAFDYLEMGFKALPFDRQLLSLTLQFALDHDRRERGIELIRWYGTPDLRLQNMLIERLEDPTATWDDFR
jgi:tetratricopeptide (TPR) repeat protein